MLALARCLNYFPLSKQTSPLTRTMSHMASETSCALRILSLQGQRRVPRCFALDISDVISSPIETPSLIRQLSSVSSKMPVHSLNLSESQTRAMWRAADCVCFDVDSTVCMDEAIDELAKFAGREKEVADLTERAMKGGMTFREALEQRLQLIQPDMQMVETYIRENPPRLSPGIEELVGHLRSRGVAVYLVSGGFQSIIEPVATELGIPHENIFANQLKFYFNGRYAGFEKNQPTSNQDGKARVIQYLKKKFGYQRVVMVGDGATDLAACPPADAFIGYGGNQVREKVKAASPWFVESFSELVKELSHA